MALSIENQTPVLQQQELLIEIEAQGTPLRIDGQTETYYVLSASQLRVLFGRLMDNGTVDDMTGFTLEDFGLTEADVAAYNETQQAQRERVASAELKPLPKNLAEQLSDLSDAGLSNGEVDGAEREKLLDELESAMLANLQAAVATSVN